MVDDILLSPEEQDERAKQWLKDNGMALVMGVVLGLGAVYAFNNYQAMQKTNAEEASVLYSQILSSVKDSDNADIENRVSTLKEDYAGSSYAAKAVLLRARQLSASNLEGSLEELQWVTENTKELGIVHTARIRQAKVLLALNKLDEAKDVASKEPYAGFDSYYQEILGDIAFAQNDFEQSRTHYQAAIDTSGASGSAYVPILNLKINRLPITDSLSDEQTDAAVSEINGVDAS